MAEKQPARHGARLRTRSGSRRAEYRREKDFPDSTRVYRIWAVGRSPVLSHQSSKHAVPREQYKWVRPCLRSGISMKYAILIDAGFIKRELGSQAEPLDAVGVRGFLASLRAHETLAAMSLHRVYWYDAPPLESRVAKPLLGGKINFGATALARSNATLLAELCQVPYVSVRRGDLAFRGWKVRQGKLPDKDPSVTLTASDLEPNIHRKRGGYAARAGYRGVDPEGSCRYFCSRGG